MGDGAGEFRAVESIEVKFVHAVGLEQTNLLGRDDDGHHAAELGVAVVHAFEHAPEPIGYAGAAECAELHALREVGHWHDSRNDRGGYAGGETPFEEPQIKGCIKKILGDGASGAGIQLPFQVVEVGLGTECLWMGFGKRGNRNLEWCDPEQAGDEIDCVAIALRMRLILLARRGVAPERDDMADACFPGTGGRPDPPRRGWRRRR